jgi:chaperonin GroES
MNLKPLFDKVIIDPHKDEKESDDGLLMTQIVKDELKRGTVLACGPGLSDQPMTVKEGDTVLYGEFTANPIEYDGRVVLLMREPDIFCIVNNSNQ